MNRRPAISSPVPRPAPAPGPPPAPDRPGAGNRKGRRRTAIAAVASALGLTLFGAGLLVFRESVSPGPPATSEVRRMAAHLQGAFNAVLPDPGLAVESVRLLHPIRGPWLVAAAAPDGEIRFYQVTMTRTAADWSITARLTDPVPP